MSSRESIEQRNTCLRADPSTSFEIPTLVPLELAGKITWVLYPLLSAAFTPIATFVKQERPARLLELRPLHLSLLAAQPKHRHNGQRTQQ